MTLTLAPETEARLRAASNKTGLSPEAVIDAALEALLNNGAASVKAADPIPVQESPAQAKLRAALLGVVAKAQALVPEPHPLNPEQSAEERLYGEILTEKYRRQGFNLP